MTPVVLSPPSARLLWGKTTQVLHHSAQLVMAAGPRRHSRATEIFNRLMLYEKVLMKMVFHYQSSRRA